MKKQILGLVAVSLIIGTSIFSVVSCTKTEQAKENTNGTITHFSPSGNMVESTIKSFIQRHSDFKAGYKTGGEDIKLGEAVWTLEASTNYEFQGPKEDLGDFVTDSMSVMVNVYVGDDNEYYVSEADAMDLYDDVISFTSTSIAPDNAKLLVTDLNATNVENGQAEMKVTTVTGKNGTNPYAINSTDYWYPSQDDGKCGNYAGQQVGRDASDRIREILNAAVVVADYWTDVVTTYPIYEVDCTCSYDQCFWEGGENDCLSPTEMQEWLNKASCIVDETIPTGYSRIMAYYHWDILVGQNYYNHFFLYIKYGIPHNNGGGH
ncbi:MAG: hypothetical protein GXO89_12000 [Chlorobi bacterium]|nr:hypothetical protein [Chlorobiota bacterium]